MEQAEYTTNNAKQKEYFENAIKYYSESIEIKSSIGDLRGVRNSKNNLAAVYQMLNRNDEALKILLELLGSAQESGELISIGNYNNNVGVVYNSLALESESKEDQAAYRQKAIGHFETGRAIRAELGDTLGLMNSLNNLAITYAEMNIHDKSILLNAEALAMAIEFGSVAEIRDISESLYTSYKATGNYKDALNMYELFILNRDSINDQGARESLLKHDMELEFERQKLEENLRHESDIQKQKNARNLTFAGAGMLFLLLVIFINRFRLKQKAAKQLEAKNAEVEAARARAERSEAFRRQFLANMSHEIRTPMNAILGMTRLLKDRKHDTQSLTYLNAVDHAANNLLVVINDVLDLSKLEAGKMEAAIHPAHLSAELDMIATTFSMRAAEKGLRFELYKKPDLPEYVLTDIARVNQILYNLLGNAVKFTDSGKVRLEVNHKNIADNKTEITFAVSDTGIGIPHEKQAGIFESFGQGHTHDSRRYGGTGLGLTIARSLVELLGGNLKLESTPGAGSTFSFAIPCTVSSTDQLATYLNLNTFTLSERHRSFPIHILLADDNEYNRLVAIDTLKKYLPHAEIDATDSGTHLLEMLPQKTYDIVLMDVQMPGMDGYDCTREIRSLADESMRNIHIVAFTASVIRTDIQKCYDAGMNGYIPKPFRDEDLLKPIAALIDKFPDRASVNQTTAHSELNQGHALFLKLVPKRLEKVKAALAAGDAGTVKKTIHLMRPQLIDAGMAENTELFEWFEYIDTDNPPEEWIAKTNLFCEKVNNRISQLE
jgi:signal transduction histidine kinase/DNA-binding NarL/FixJ family response regulator